MDRGVPGDTFREGVLGLSVQKTDRDSTKISNPIEDSSVFSRVEVWSLGPVS